MKIGILTQPLGRNYGGILQAYALQKVLKSIGHEAWIINRNYYSSRDTLYLRMRRNIRNVLKKILGYSSYDLSENEKNFIFQNFSLFIDNYLQPITKVAYTNNQLRKIVKEIGFDAFVVGSDQVWRPEYSPNITNYFLDFVGKEDVKKIAYAASYGVDIWEYTKKQTEMCSALLQKFNFVSVREDSAVSITDKYFQVKATHVLDPVMLLDRAEYDNLANIGESKNLSKNIFCYLLDEDEEKTAIMKKIISDTGLTPFSILPESATNERVKHNIDRCKYPPMAQWLRSFATSGMVLTDSFHGCVLSIIYNKPFWVIPNKNRGLTRFSSLLSLFNLKERIIDSTDMNNIDFAAEINWNMVNDKLQQQRGKSFAFLYESLNS